MCCSTMPPITRSPTSSRACSAPIIGSGLLTSDGDLWREQRRIVAASFSPAAVEAQRPTFVEAARRAHGEWSDGERRDMAAEATADDDDGHRVALFGGDPRLITEDVDGATSPPRIEGFSRSADAGVAAACRNSR